MKTLASIFHILALFFILGGLGSCVLSRTAVHDIGGLVAILIAVVLMGFGAIIQAIDELGRRIAPPKV